jgi:hypothetical protein
MKMSHIPRDRVVAAALGFAVLLLIVMGVLAYRGGGDNEGEGNSDCEQFSLPSKVGTSGWIVSGHITGCSPPAASVSGYVYVHPKDQKENIEFMVFRYLDSSKGDDIIYRWIDGRTVAISIRSVAKITRLRRSIGPIQIVYEIGTEEYPRSE